MWFPYKLTRLFSDQNNKTHTHFFLDQKRLKNHTFWATQSLKGRVYLPAALFLAARQGFKIEQSSPHERSFAASWLKVINSTGNLSTSSWKFKRTPESMETLRSRLVFLQHLSFSQTSCRSTRNIISISYSADTWIMNTWHFFLCFLNEGHSIDRASSVFILWKRLSCTFDYVKSIHSFAAKETRTKKLKKVSWSEFLCKQKHK